MSGRTVSVSEGLRLARSIAVGPHTLTADESEPISMDAGPTPVELLLATLGSCTSMAVRACAGRHRWQLHHIDVDLQFDPRGQIVKNIRLTGDLAPDQIERLLAVPPAVRCAAWSRETHRSSPYPRFWHRSVGLREPLLRGRRIRRCPLGGIGVQRSLALVDAVDRRNPRVRVTSGVDVLSSLTQAFNGARGQLIS